MTIIFKDQLPEDSNQILALCWLGRLYERARATIKRPSSVTGGHCLC